jgi:hypothetical protein
MHLGWSDANGSRCVDFCVNGLGKKANRPWMTRSCCDIKDGFSGGDRLQ